MIEHVTIERSTWQRAPYRFEAGTPNIAGVIGLGAAIAYVQELPRGELLAHEDALVRAALDGLEAIPGVRLVGRPSQRVGVISFLLGDGHPHDVGTLLDQQGIAVRTGHHCAMPLMQRLGIPGTVRASFSLYNSRTDVERFLAGVEKTSSFL
jgi:cysteine desulfurase/selenocysteine lyase